MTVLGCRRVASVMVLWRPVPGNDGQDDLGTAEAEVQPADVGGKYLYEIQCFHEHVFTTYYYVMFLLFSCYSHSSGQEGDLIFLSKSSSGWESLEKHCTALTVAACGRMILWNSWLRFWRRLWLPVRGMASFFCQPGGQCVHEEGIELVGVFNIGNVA